MEWKSTPVQDKRNGAQVLANVAGIVVLCYICNCSFCHQVPLLCACWRCYVFITITSLLRTFLHTCFCLPLQFSILLAFLFFHCAMTICALKWNFIELPAVNFPKEFALLYTHIHFQKQKKKYKRKLSSEIMLVGIDRLNGDLDNSVSTPKCMYWMYIDMTGLILPIKKCRLNVILLYTFWRATGLHLLQQHGVLKTQYKVAKL